MNNRIKFIMVAFVAIISIASCKKEIDWDGSGPNTNPGSGNGAATSEYYITFKADGVAITEKEVSAIRNTSSSPRSLTILGTMANGTSPRLKFFSNESFIGFSPGLNTGNSDYTYPFSYVEYTNASNALYSTINDSEGIYFFYSDVSYTNGGVIKGSFSGQVKGTNGAIVRITEGKFNLKFSN
ncbi:hypothetical protein [Pedobacter psychrotolerans]|uniref:Lipoprotein n=2 Tax=Pedobacter psychrotolerans TaxID=1843235 RepID=A0ABQ1SQD0_9SPHI|nr:hypothetical protein [Pedobacter psychrotolerans]GGE54484.1 hypothetical protein GCM10011413_21070 [Pedobacter psychrotolerans]